MNFDIFWSRRIRRCQKVEIDTPAMTVNPICMQSLLETENWKYGASTAGLIKSVVMAIKQCPLIIKKVYLKEKMDGDRKIPKLF